MRRVAVLLVLIAACAPSAVPAATRAGHTVFQSRHLWATVDVCNSRSHPGTVGVRGSMPGSGNPHEAMFMRVALQWLTPAGRWRPAGPAADSGFFFVGRGSYKARQAGRNFVLGQTHSAATYLLRGIVTFQWRRHGHVVFSARKATTPGHVSVAGADPPNYSAAACAL